MSNWYERQKRERKRERKRRDNKSAGFTRHGDPYHPGDDNSVDRTATPMMRIMRFTTLRGLFLPFFKKVIELLVDDSPMLEDADVEHFRGSDIGFKLTLDEEDLAVEVKFIARRGFMLLDIDGSHGGQDFSATHRLFQEDTIRKIAREISIRIPV